MAITKSTAADQIGGASGVGAASAVVLSGEVRGDYVGGGAEYGDDMDADDLPMQGNGTPDGHSDCVPAGGAWPVTGR